MLFRTFAIVTAAADACLSALSSADAPPDLEEFRTVSTAKTTTIEKTGLVARTIVTASPRRP